jgi:hypothetical protein
MYGFKLYFSSLVNSSCIDGYVCMDGCVDMMDMMLS